MERLKKIKVLASDVDGVLTDGGLLYTEESGSSKIFNVQDGLGIRLAMLSGLDIALVTGNVSTVVSRRATDLGVSEVYQGARFKTEAILEIATRNSISLEEIAYVGDDLNDLPAMELVGVSFAVANAAQDVKDAASFTTAKSGGTGAVREIIETILKAQGKWEDAVKTLLKEFEREQAEGNAARAAG